MKKLLLATSILAGSAGVAAAEVTFSGNAYMGISNEQAVGGGGDASDLYYIARVRATISMVGETDGGLSFGAKFDLHNAAAAGSSGGDYQQGSATAWIEGEFGKITFGDTGPSSDNIIGNVDGVGLALPGGGDYPIAPLGYQELGYGIYPGYYVKTGVTYEKTFGDFTFGISTGQTSAVTGYDYFGVAGKYSFGGGNYAVYIGFDQASSGGSSISQTTIGADATFGNFTVKFRATDLEGASDPSYAISGTGKFGQITATAFYADHYGIYNAYGIGGSYDLGGGASFKAGAQQSDVAGTDTMFDMGLKFDF
jgi:outer membrane protein OmpU